MPSRLIELEIPRPGIAGVNTSASGDVMPKEYSIKTTNMVFSDKGYLEARRGTRRDHSATIQATLSAAGVQTVRSIYYTTDQVGGDLLILSSEDGILKIASNTLTDITGTITAPTAGNWKFQNLNDKVIGHQAGHGMIELTTPSTGTFNDITFTGTEAPTTNGSVATDILAAAGRLWILDGDQLRYSSLLDHTDFDPTGGDAGAFDLNAARLNGEDKPIALREFNGNILVFYTQHVVVYGGIWNPNNSTPGTNPETPMALIENISGVGCIARDSIQETQNDILFLSEQGVTTLSRVIQEKSMPLNRLSDNIREDTQSLTLSGDNGEIWSCYVEGKGAYLIGTPNYAETLMIDVSAQLPDGTHRCTTWNKAFTTAGVTPMDMITASEDIWSTVYVSDEANYISKLKGYLDGVVVGGTGGSTYDIEWESAWTAILEDYENNIKIPKHILTVVNGGGSQDVTVNLAYDYGGFTDTKARTFTIPLAPISVYGTATYGGTTQDTTTGYYGSATAIATGKGMGFGKGRIMKVNIKSTVNQYALSLQRISIKAKLGRQE